MIDQMTAIVAEGDRKRFFVSPDRRAYPSRSICRTCLASFGTVMPDHAWTLRKWTWIWCYPLASAVSPNVNSLALTTFSDLI